LSLVQYVGLSAQLALERRLEAIAQNVANLGTAGYRAEEIKFETVLSKALGYDAVAYSSPGDTFISREAGPLMPTGNALDLAVEGDAWIAMQTPAGTVYSRDGRMKILETGELVTLNDHPVLDAGGAPILLDPVGGAPQFARDGMITQDGVEVGAIGLFAIDERARLSRYEGAGVIPDRAPEPVLDFTATGVVQGFVEGANVNPVLELTKLIMVQRSFESATSAVEQTDNAQREAIRALGKA
jgi:flagellar basal-body rod protein FlgF